MPHQAVLNIGLNYMVTVDSEGKLRWARNNQLVDTTAGHWKDAGQGHGIVPYEVADMEELHPPDARASSTSSLSSAAMHYVEPLHESNNFVRVMKKNLTVHGLANKLLRKTVRRNTWIYVSVRMVYNCRCRDY